MAQASETVVVGRILVACSSVIFSPFVGANALRELFKGDVATITTIWGVLWTLLLFGLGLWFATRTFRKDNA